METKSAAVRLKAIRESTKLSLQVIADRMRMKLSSYRHYEERYKGNSLPADLVEKLLVAFEDHPEVEDDIRALIKLPPHDRQGMSEPGARMRGQALADALYDDKRSTPEITIRIDGTHIQVAAKVDRQGIDRLIEKLEIAKDLLD